MEGHWSIKTIRTQISSRVVPPKLYPKSKQPKIMKRCREIIDRAWSLLLNGVVIRQARDSPLSQSILCLYPDTTVVLYALSKELHGLSQYSLKWYGSIF